MDHFLRALFFLLVTVTVSGDLIYTGTDFVLALFPAYETALENKTAGTLYISHKEEGLCNITDSDGGTHTVSLHGRDTVTEFHLPVVRLLKLGTFIETRGINIHCSVNVNIVVFFRNIDAGLSDAYPVLPVETLSTKYFIPSVNTNALIGIIAIQDNTSVNIHLKTSCNYKFLTKYFGNNNILSTTLQKRQVLQIASTTSTASNQCDFGGTVIISNHRVAVMSGSTMLVYPMDKGDGAMSQVPPIESLGRTFFVPPLPDVDKYTLRIVSGYTGTNVTIAVHDKVESFILNEGDLHQEMFEPLTSVYITSSNGVLVLQITGKTTYAFVFSCVVQALEDFGTDYLVPYIQAERTNYNRWISVVTEPRCVPDININGPWTTNRISSKEFSVAHFLAPSSITRVTSRSDTCKFGLQVYGFWDNEMYGYFLPSTECPARTYSKSCKFCDTRHCQNTSTTCDRMTGACAGCKPGWIGKDCSRACLKYFFGIDCKRHCGKCAGNASCHYETGICATGCGEGYHGPLCREVCEFNLYGQGCNLTCGNCFNNKTCEPESGRCTDGCQPGFQKPFCQDRCVCGKYGLNCMRSCGQCNGTCDVVDGHCPGGCLEGYTGPRCEPPSDQSEANGEVKYALIGAGSATAITLLVIGVVLCCLLRCGRLQMVRSEPSKSVIEMTTDLGNTKPIEDRYSGLNPRDSQIRHYDEISEKIYENL